MQLNIKSQVLLNQHGLLQLYNPDMSIGERIKQVRVTNKLSQERFGELCGVSKGMVSQWENNIVTPPIDRLITLKIHFEFSFDWVYLGNISDYSTRLRPPAQQLMQIAQNLPDEAVSELAREGNVYAKLIASAKKDHNGTK